MESCGLGKKCDLAIYPYALAYGYRATRFTGHAQCPVAQRGSGLMPVDSSGPEEGALEARNSLLLLYK